MATDCIATTGNIIVGNLAYVQACIHEGYGSCLVCQSVSVSVSSDCATMDTEEDGHDFYVLSI